jgi:hypothetical protein
VTFDATTDLTGDELEYTVSVRSATSPRATGATADTPIPAIANAVTKAETL